MTGTSGYYAWEPECGPSLPIISFPIICGDFLDRSAILGPLCYNWDFISQPQCPLAPSQSLCTTMSIPQRATTVPPWKIHCPCMESLQIQAISRQRIYKWGTEQPIIRTQPTPVPYPQPAPILYTQECHTDL